MGVVQRRECAALVLAASIFGGCATADQSGGTYNDLGVADESVAEDVPGVTVDAEGTADVAVARMDASDVSPRDASVDVPIDAGPCVEGTTRGCYLGPAGTRGVGLCADGFQRCAAGAWAASCNGQNLPQAETCNGIDDDCNGVADDIPATSCYTGAPSTRDVGICHPGSLRCDGVMAVCAGQVVPQTAETCGNHLDDNCNGLVDEGC